MGNLGDLIPPGEDTEIRAQRDTDRRQQEEAAARRAARTQIGAGGIVQVDGTLEVNGDLIVPAGSLNSPGGSMAAGVDVIAGNDVTAGRDVVATRDVLAYRDVAAAVQVRANNGLFPGGINSVDVYNRLVTGSGSFRSTSTNILGQMGQTVSSARYKQDIVTAVIPREVLRKLRLVFFRYVANVPFDQDQQPVLLGLLAEEVHQIGLTWLVIYDEKGRPEALVDFALPFLGLALAQDAENRADEAEERLAVIEKALGLSGPAEG